MRKYVGPQSIHPLDDYYKTIRFNYAAILRQLADDLENDINLPIPFAIFPCFEPSHTQDRGMFYLYIAENQQEVQPLLNFIVTGTIDG